MAGPEGVKAFMRVPMDQVLASCYRSDIKTVPPGSGREQKGGKPRIITEKQAVPAASLKSDIPAKIFR